jgi:hypothetical protein
LLGYLFAWGMILIDRQMLIEEQGKLRKKADSALLELKTMKKIEGYNEDITSQIDWNREALEDPEPKPTKEEKCLN